MAEANKKRATSEKILLAATALFAKYDFKMVSVKQIAEKAGVNVALISYYFGGKQKLYAEVLQRQTEILLRTTAEVDSLPLEPAEKLRCLFERTLETQYANGNALNAVYKALLDPTPESDAIVTDAIFKIKSCVTRCANEAKREGILRADVEPRAVSYALLSMLGTYFLARRQMMELRMMTAAELKQSVERDCLSVLGAMLVQPSERKEHGR